MKYEYGSKDVNGFLTGLLVGGLAGAGTMLLLAPHSGKRTRAKLQEKSLEMRNQTVQAVEETVTQVRAKASQITETFQKQADELQKLGQDMLDKQKERWAPVIEAGKTAAHGG